MSRTLSTDHQEILSSPLPGKVIKILVHEGEYVQEGQSIFMIETMKMVHELRVIKPGKLQEIHVNVGDVIAANNQLATIK